MIGRKELERVRDQLEESWTLAAANDWDAYDRGYADGVEKALLYLDEILGDSE